MVQSSFLDVLDGDGKHFYEHGVLSDVLSCGGAKWTPRWVGFLGVRHAANGSARPSQRQMVLTLKRNVFRTLRVALLVWGRNPSGQ